MKLSVLCVRGGVVTKIRIFLSVCVFRGWVWQVSIMTGFKMSSKPGDDLKQHQQLNAADILRPAFFSFCSSSTLLKYLSLPPHCPSSKETFAFQNCL